jgi:2,4-dienoyl-CoA reductase-like NADH-dependent reductase (Old Yellow Enzyme family)
MATLFDPVRMGELALPNRILMAPLTRGRATSSHVPTGRMLNYYRQRASAGLIITEATAISPETAGWPYAPGIWSDAQVEAWRRVTGAVHEEGGRIAVQLWHMGRVVHPDMASGRVPLSASASTAPGEAHTYAGRRPYVQARAMDRDDIRRVLEQFEDAAARAMAAGFDAVQIHAANGYLIDQFLRDGSNLRDDDYGGSIANRIRLLREVTERVIAVAGSGRTSVRLSPNGEVQGVNDSDPVALFTAAAAALDELGIAFLELREPPLDGSFGKADRPPVHPAIRRVFRGPLVLNSDYDQAKAQGALAAGQADAVAFGRAFIANPDLPWRFAFGLPLSHDDPASWYSNDAAGYDDYPAALDAGRDS